MSLDRTSKSGFSWTKTPRPMVALAPMAGVTDASYRQFIKKICPETILYSEFLSTDAISYGAKKTMTMMEFNPAIEQPFIVQIFGDEPEHFLTAAKVVEQMGADGIDINMGCPAAKVVSSCHGAALIKSPELAAELVHATCKAVSIPVSVKTRLGWDKKDGLITFCRGLVEAGASSLAIHGRRYCDKFGGEADWEPIYRLKEAFPHIPVLGNGDIKSGANALEKLKNLDGVMVGRATFGNPWVMADIVESFKTGVAVTPTVGQLSFAQKVPFILDHCRLSVEVKGPVRGVREMRRHLCGYVKGFDGAAEIRAQLMVTDDPEAVMDIVKRTGEKLEKEILVTA